MRVPDRDGTTATFTGTFRKPARSVVPAAMASATPDAERFGPTPNSVPLAVLMPTIQLRLGRATP